MREGDLVVLPFEDFTVGTVCFCPNKENVWVMYNTSYLWVGPLSEISHYEDVK